VKELCPLTAKELARAERKLLYPIPGSRIEAAQQYGIDLTLLLSQLRDSPAERARDSEDASTELEQVRGILRRKRT
jgi:hypothetical protein